MRKLSVFIKIGMGFGIITMLGVGVAGFAFWGFKTLQRVTRASELTQEFLLREIDHLKWAAQLEEQVRNNKPIEVQRDPTKCAFGKWYYGESRLLIQSHFPDLVSDLRNLEAPHKRLHETSNVIYKLIQDNKYSEAQSLLSTTVKSELQEVQKNLLNVRNKMTSEIKKYGESSDQIATRFVIIMSGLLLTLIGLSLVIGYFIAKSISEPVQKVIVALQNSARQFISHSEALEQGSVKLLSSSQSQSVSSQETAASVTEIEALAQKNAENSDRVARAAQHAMDKRTHISIHQFWSKYARATSREYRRAL